MYDLNEFAKEVHENAVEHGFWDEERHEDETFALICCEWAEAVEEARAGRDMVWYQCMEADGGIEPCQPKDEYECLNYGNELSCKHRGKKPEGIAVELIDGVIRILDLCGKQKLHIHAFGTCAEDVKDDRLTELVMTLNELTGIAYSWYGTERADYFRHIIRAVFAWIEAQGLDPMKIAKEKHEYNKSRPYKHGKRF